MINLKKSDLLIDSKRFRLASQSHTVGYAFKCFGKEYSDYVIIEDEINEEILKEVLEIFIEKINYDLSIIYKENLIILKE